MSSALRRFVTDCHGRVVLAQPPNRSLLAWVIFAAAGASEGRAESVLRTARDAALAWSAGRSCATVTARSGARSAA